jgi:hypothetical protein
MAQADIVQISNLVSSEDRETLKKEIIAHLNEKGIRVNAMRKRQKGQTDRESIMKILQKIFPTVNKQCGGKFKEIVPGMLTITEYESGGRIMLHRDFPNGSGATHTLLIYVNDEFDDGETVFYPGLIPVVPRSQYVYNGTYLQMPEASDKIEIKPVGGSAIVFDTDIPHMSNACKNGKKYLIGCKLLPVS